VRGFGLDRQFRRRHAAQLLVAAAFLLGAATGTSELAQVSTRALSVAQVPGLGSALAPPSHRPVAVPHRPVAPSPRPAAVPPAPPGRPGPPSPSTPAAPARTAPPVQLDLRLGLVGQLGVGATNLAPGEAVEREVELVNVGNLTIATVTLAARVTPPSSPLATALNVAFTACSVPWTATGDGYACPGTVRTAVPAGPLASFAARTVPLGALGALAPGQRVSLVEEVALPASAGNAVAGAATEATWTFTATGP
jgi:hypothetical protein